MLEKRSHRKKTPDKPSHPEVEALVEDLRAWCEARRGRNAQIAETLGVSRQLVSDWLARRADPQIDVFFALRDFLRSHKRKDVGSGIAQARRSMPG